MGFDPSMDAKSRQTAESADPPDTTVTNLVIQLMRQNSHRWFSPYEVSQLVQARSAARRMREIMEEDRESVAGFPEDERAARREYEEQEVPNTIRQGKHKVYRWKGRKDPTPPELF